MLVTNVQTINAPVSPDDDDDDDTGIAQVTGTQYVVTLALSPEQSERFVFATEFGNVWLSIEPATRRRRRHPAGHPRQRVHGGEVMEPSEAQRRHRARHVAGAVRRRVGRAAQMGVVVKAERLHRHPRERKVIVVVSPKGGSGKTAVSTNLAVAIAQRHPGRVVAVDLDVQFGDLALALSLTPSARWPQLARSSQIDATTLKLHLTPTRHGLFVLAGATDPVDAESIGPLTCRRWCRCWPRTSTT